MKNKTCVFTTGAMALFSKMIINNGLYCAKSLEILLSENQESELVACVQSVTAIESFHSWFQFATIASKTITHKIE